MECPYCKQEMERGYIQCRDGVTWTPKKQPVKALSFLAKGAVSLRNDGTSSSSTVIAYHCKNCKLVLISYQDA